MHLANVVYAGYAELLDLLKPVEALLDLVNFEAPILFSISSDEQSLQDIISELIMHDIESSSAKSMFGLKVSQMRVFDFL